jgi:hypothetical protein
MLQCMLVCIPGFKAQGLLFLGKREMLQLREAGQTTYVPTSPIIYYGGLVNSRQISCYCTQ